jgi:hypothetical protein
MGWGAVRPTKNSDGPNEFRFVARRIFVGNSWLPRCLVVSFVSFTRVRSYAYTVISFYAYKLLQSYAYDGIRVLAMQYCAVLIAN